MNMDMRDIYEEMILDHNRSPRNFMKSHANTNCHAEGFNPICNDKFSLHLLIQDNHITEATFEGDGCAISTASASMMTEAIIGKTTTEANTLFENVHNLLTHDGKHENVGKLVALDGVRDYPNRVKCATLAWHILHAAIEGDHHVISTE